MIPGSVLAKVKGSNLAGGGTGAAAPVPPTAAVTTARDVRPVKANASTTNAGATLAPAGCGGAARNGAWN